MNDRMTLARDTTRIVESRSRLLKSALMVADEHRGIRPGIRERRRAELRAALIDLARQEVHRVGYSSFSLSFVCESAYISERTFYRYFASKDELLLSTIEVWYDAINVEFIAQPDDLPIAIAYANAQEAAFLSGTVSEIDAHNTAEFLRFIPQLRRNYVPGQPTEDLDALGIELGRRMRLPANSAQVVLCRSWLSSCVQVAIQDWNGDQNLERLIGMIRENLTHIVPAIEPLRSPPR